MTNSVYSCHGIAMSANFVGIGICKLFCVIGEICESLFVMPYMLLQKLTSQLSLQQSRYELKI